MTQNFVFPGGLDTYVPSLTEGLIVEYSRNPNQFPAVKYIDYHQVDKQKGYWINLQNQVQSMVLNATDGIWADGGDRQFVDQGNDPFDFPQYKCVRRSLGRRLGLLSIQQAGSWDILGQHARTLSQQMMVARVKRMHTTLTTSANWGNNYATSTTAGGGTWANATAALPYIRTGLIYAQIAITKATNSVVQSKDLYLVLNPNAAKTLATSQEFLVFLEQNVHSLPIWEANSDQFRLYGLPPFFMGLQIVVDDTVANTGPPGMAVSATNSFTLSDSYAILMSKQKAVTGGGSSYSTFSPFLYEDFNVETFQDPENRLVKLSVSENIDDSSNALVAPQSGFLIKIDS